MTLPEKRPKGHFRAQIFFSPALVFVYPDLNILKSVKKQPHSCLNIHWLNVSVSLNSPERHHSPALLPPFYTTDISPNIVGGEGGRRGDGAGGRCFMSAGDSSLMRKSRVVSLKQLEMPFKTLQQLKKWG